MAGSEYSRNASIITNHKGNVRLLYNTFYGAQSFEEMESKGESKVRDGVDVNHDQPPFATSVVVNDEGNLVLEGNCFIWNTEAIAPVISYQGTVSVIRNGGNTPSTAATPEACEFAAIVLLPSEPTSPGQDSSRLPSDNGFTCIDFDVADDCAAPGGADLSIPRGVPENSTVVDKAPLPGFQTPSGSSGVALYFFVALIGAIIVVGLGVVVSYNVRRRATALQVPSFRSDPIPSIM
jgi:hypothetical protein